MQSLKPNVAETGRYSISETCNALGIHRNTLRAYTKNRFIKCGYRKGTNKVFYTGSEIIRFWAATI